METFVVNELRRQIGWLTWLRDHLGDAFVHGVVLHTGDRPLAFGDRLSALPISYLWTAD